MSTQEKALHLRHVVVSYAMEKQYVGDCNSLVSKVVSRYADRFARAKDPDPTRSCQRPWTGFITVEEEVRSEVDQILREEVIDFIEDAVSGVTVSASRQ